MASGENNHWHDKTNTIYRPLETDEYNGKTYLKSSEMEIWRSKGDTIYDRILDKIDNRVPKRVYHITAKGKYRNDFKEGKWVYYHNNGILKKEIHYQSLIPTKGISIYRPNNSKMIDVIKISDDNWEIIKYSESVIEIERMKRKTKEIELLF
jgi:antitoxin component YwqK of YwqJK toxin-antitoxin module